MSESGLPFDRRQWFEQLWCAVGLLLRVCSEEEVPLCEEGLLISAGVEHLQDGIQVENKGESLRKDGTSE
jgi:hypothetical protein